MALQIENIEAAPSVDGGEGLLAMIIRGSPEGHGTSFVTSPDRPIQVGFLSHRFGWDSAPHRHYPSPREIRSVTEVLVMREGVVRVDFYDSARNWVRKAFLREGDVLIQFQGGHAFTAITEFHAIEIKQGPYRGEADKTYFTPAG